MVAANGSFASGNDYAPGYGFAGGLALAGDLLFSAYGTQANSGTGLMAFALGLAYGPPPATGRAPVPCGIARSPVVVAGSFSGLQAERYFGLAVHGGHLFAARGGLPSVRLLDVFDLAAFAPYETCVYQNGFAVGPAPARSFTLLGEPRDVAVHRRWAFVAETDGFEILDVANPVSPAARVHQSFSPGATAIAVRPADCAGSPCYRIFLAASDGVHVYTWPEGGASVTAAGTLSALGGAAAVLAAHDLLVQGHASSGGLGFFDTTTAPGTFQSYSIPQPGGGVYALGAAGRYVYANDDGSFVVQELQ